jgi:hypothetical protein
MGLPRQGEDPSLNTLCRIQGPKLGSNKLLSLGLGCAHPAQPQLRLEHEQLSSLNGKGNCLGAHWNIVLPVTGVLFYTKRSVVYISV